MSPQQPYDEFAEEYAANFSDSLSKYPLERGLLASFAELAKEVGGPVADVGCGPGHVTAYLSGLGLDAFGVDVSSGMIAVARARNPELRFEVGSMAALDVADGSLSGILSRYSIIHTAPEDVPATLAEFRRVLAPGGCALISFPGTDDDSSLTVSYDHKVYTAYRWWPDHFSALLHEAGLEEVGRLVERPVPEAPRQFPVVNLFARRAA
ncbi:class I SAM-dependent methyltransferase [Catenulispora sp. NF23]|uniref:class I SAM-dependent DNA methyltransferase n=1 Tax=Catenulispora pinistramenti TaxID=2705254 RepID=UPI001BA569CB|nr:class I SAM-dependent methyltransferase [Catenulispora pinistramenti]MBS2535120.1 class I SAM-dependent methyltransferase [Catenulispora pinistramenti]